MGNEKYRNSEKKKVLRAIYKPDRRSVLKVGKNEFMVADISEMGLAFFNDRQIGLGNRVCGTITLLCGELLDVEGIIVRKRRVGICMNVNTPIPRKIIVREQQHINQNL